MNVAATRPPDSMREASDEEVARSEALLAILKAYPPSIAVDMLVFACTQLVMSMVPDDPARQIDRLEIWNRISSAVHGSIEINEERLAKQAGPP